MLGRCIFCRLNPKSSGNPEGEPKNHLWVVITNPTANHESVVVNITTKPLVKAKELRISADTEISPQFIASKVSWIVPQYIRCASVSDLQNAISRGTDYGVANPHFLAWLQRTAMEYVEDFNNAKAQAAIDFLIETGFSP